MKKRNTQFAEDATVLEEPARANGEDAPADVPAPPPEPPAPPPALLDLPVAAVLPPVAPLLHTAADAAPLEARIRRLETELAELRTAQPRDPRGGAFQAASADPAAAVVRRPGRLWADLGKRLTASSGPAAAPPPRTETLASMVPAGVRRGWMLWDALTELRAIYWMYFDPRYRLSWTARLAPVFVLALIVTSGFWLPLAGLYYFGFVIDKIADLALAYVLFKLVSHESRRYRETAPDLPPSLRL